MDQNLDTIQELNDQVTINPQVCVGYYVGLTYNHGRVYFGRGYGGASFPGVALGWTSKPYDEVQNTCYSGIEVYFGPGFGSSGNSEYSETQIGLGLGIAVMYRNKTTEMFTLPWFG